MPALDWVKSCRTCPQKQWCEGVQSAAVVPGSCFRHKNGHTYRVEAVRPIAGGYVVTATSGELRIRSKRSRFARDLCREVTDRT